MDAIDTPIIPTHPTCESTRCQAISDIITSIALEQTSLSNILTAESEKIQKTVTTAKTTEEMLHVNKSVKSIINSITRLEMVLENKLELFEDCLCVNERPR